MDTKLPRRTDVRRGPKSAGFWPAAKKILRFDRHGEVVEDLDDACGATVQPKQLEIGWSR